MQNSFSSSLQIYGCSIHGAANMEEIYRTLQQFSEISDFIRRDFNKISKRPVRDFKGVADPLSLYGLMAFNWLLFT